MWNDKQNCTKRIQSKNIFIACFAIRFFLYACASHASALSDSVFYLFPFGGYLSFKHVRSTLCCWLWTIHLRLHQSASREKGRFFINYFFLFSIAFLKLHTHFAQHLLCKRQMQSDLDSDTFDVDAMPKHTWKKAIKRSGKQTA